MNNNKNAVVNGVIVPIITPVDQNENVDEVAFRAAIRRCLDAGVDGIFAGGSAGMGPLLSDDQWQRAMEIASDEVDSDRVLLGGAISTSTRRAVEKIKVLEKTGFKHMAVTPSFYYTLKRDQEFLAHFDKCRQASSMDMVVYNIPSCTYSSIPLSVLEQMASQGWFTTMKESGGDRAYFKTAMEISLQYGFDLLQGNEPDIAWGLSCGAKGIIPVCANYEPQTFVAAWNASKNGDNEMLEQAQKRADYIREILLINSENWIAGIMYGVASLGIGSGIPVLPLEEVSESSKKQIDALNIINLCSGALNEHN
ncbi:4-hydroxy-tetrahydrodipicolinate synthase [Limihaloglobus sulfuriphilus]|uniref:4-hydroxy-tetrahydrodipicolinate synthase n=1 Tax=Limihaloglobus sulfuriphilus TaxID=1851148 RepID=A0A1Q2MDZ3_9BACT|nr:dihydrodipicolinate synthase family protein [Limihaloglobus sulfuriphilus]AQQ70482.1 4-hydroxy-tetrahydrodipicolinate synthase [Limihaloglobus sulfuriphilus]